MYHLAQLHVKIIDDLKTIYLQNIQDLKNLISNENMALLYHFYKLKTTVQDCPQVGHVPGNQLLHSFQNTGRPQYHGNVFISGSQPYLSRQRVGSIRLCNYSLHTPALLRSLNPQDDAQAEFQPNKKRFCQS